MPYISHRKHRICAIAPVVACLIALGFCSASVSAAEKTVPVLKYQYLPLVTEGMHYYGTI